MAVPKLSSFQEDKFSFLFTTLFGKTDKALDSTDVSTLAERMRVYSGWKLDDKEYIFLVDVLHSFHECLVDHVKEERGGDDELEGSNLSWEEAVSRSTTNMTKSISLKEWLSMWTKLCRGAAGLGDFPMWVQLLPRIFFAVIDNNNDGVLTKDEYRRFYQTFVGLGEDTTNLDKITNEGIRAMTANGDYDFDLGQFNFCFANFLLGRSIYGPGKYIFGNFDNSDIDSTYKINYE